MKFLLLLCTLASIISCQNNRVQDEITPVTSVADSIITLGDPNFTNKIKTEKIVSEPYLKKTYTSGIVKAIPNNYAEIASPFAGRITKSFVNLGQKVETGSPIFEISSPAFFDAGKAYYQSMQEMQLAEKNLKRQQDLFKNGVGTQKDLDEAEVSYELSKRDYENSIASLKVYHVNPEELILGQPLVVRSPIKGEIVENKIVIGQYLKEDAEPVAIVAELSNVWVIGQLKEKDINSVHLNEKVEIRLTGMHDIPIDGSVFHIGELLDEATRSVQVYVLCKNIDRVMKPGMFVSTQFSENKVNEILIPTAALFQMEDASFVYIHTGNNRYIRRNVDVNGTDGDRVIIKSGLNPGDEIVVEGGILLMNLNTQTQL
jgi:cobalt-zinc-cadmium efflux system membrane fusion protein